MFGLASQDLNALLILVVCLLVSAFFSAAETAVTSIGALKTKHLIESNVPAARYFQFWLRQPSRVLTTILIFNNLVNILASAVMTALATRHYDNAVGVATGIVTFMVLIFGEIIPKSFARANSEAMAPFALRFIRVCYVIFFPLVWVLSEFANRFIRLLGSHNSFTPTLTEEELEFMISEGSSNGVIEDIKKNMINGVFDFDETKVGEIMTPRTDVIAVERQEELQEALRLAIESAHSRIPVYDERIDNVVGILFAKDLLRYLSTNQKLSGSVATLMREPYFVPESKRIMDVFTDLKRTKNHMAIVIDEYGGTAGIVTMEDILEEIVGDIQDEFDVEEVKILEVEHGVYDVSGSTNVDEFKEYFDLEKTIEDEEHDDVDTVAGWIIQELGDMPEVGQSITLGPLSIEITEVGRHRIEQVRVVRLAKTQSEEVIQT